MEDKSGLYIVAIVGVVALVAMIVLITGGNRDDNTGQASRVVDVSGAATGILAEVDFESDTSESCSITCNGGNSDSATCDPGKCHCECGGGTYAQCGCKI